MTLLIATLIAIVGAAVTGFAVPIVLDDWIWLVAYMVTVPTILATLAAWRDGPASYPSMAAGTVLSSALVLALIEAGSGYMELAPWYLFIATFPVALVIGVTAALVVGAFHWRRAPRQSSSA